MEYLCMQLHLWLQCDYGKQPHECMLSLGAQAPQPMKVVPNLTEHNAN